MQSIEEILEEAKLRYPNGTKYVPAHLHGKSVISIVGNTNDFSIYNGIGDDIIKG